MNHEEIGGGLLPEFSVWSLIQMAGSEPGRAAREKRRESDINRETMDGNGLHAALTERGLAL
jgi:hypothetical protein